jgi:hypothetical protein
MDYFYKYPIKMENTDAVKIELNEANNFYKSSIINFFEFKNYDIKKQTNLEECIISLNDQNKLVFNNSDNKGFVYSTIKNQKYERRFVFNPKTKQLVVSGKNVYNKQECLLTPHQTLSEANNCNKSECIGGEIFIVDGVVKCLNTKSGYYRTEPTNPNLAIFKNYLNINSYKEFSIKDGFEIIIFTNEDVNEGTLNLSQCALKETQKEDKNSETLVSLIAESVGIDSLIESSYGISETYIDVIQNILTYSYEENELEYKNKEIFNSEKILKRKSTSNSNSTFDSTPISSPEVIIKQFKYNENNHVLNKFLDNYFDQIKEKVSGFRNILNDHINNLKPQENARRKKRRRK